LKRKPGKSCTRRGKVLPTKIRESKNTLDFMSFGTFLRRKHE